MMTGSRLIAPEGFLSLSKGVIYHFVGAGLILTQAAGADCTARILRKR